MEHLDVERALKLAGLESPADADFHISGQDPSFPPALSGYRGGRGAAAYRHGRRDLWRLRTGRSQQVIVDARHAAASLGSYRYARRLDDPQTAPDRSRKPARTWPGHPDLAAQGRPLLQLHGSFHDAPESWTSSG